ncbi:MAG: cobalamin-dependent protein, partial [Bacteroidales bacterium]|nr:cobalamin-dependent protein [Bacteroidales bacterium]
MKTAFITVRPKYNSYGLFSIAPLGPVYLATMLSNKGHEARVFDESRSFVFNRRNGKVNPAVLKSDFIGLSVISPAANRAKELIEAIRQQKPDIRMAVGGPHVTGEEQAREFAQFVDVVVQNEAETIIDEVVNGKLNG